MIKKSNSKRFDTISGYLVWVIWILNLEFVCHLLFVVWNLRCKLDLIFEKNAAKFKLLSLLRSAGFHQLNQFFIRLRAHQRHAVHDEGGHGRDALLI